MGQGGEIVSRHPEIVWAQRSATVYLTVELPDAKNPQVKLEPDGRFKFSAIGGSDNVNYEADLELYGNVDVDGSKINVGPRHIFCEIEKGEEGWWKRLHKKEGKAPAYLRADWNRWVDEDEEEVEVQGHGGNDYDSMGDFTTFGVDSDDEDEELPDVNETSANEEKLPETSSTDDKEDEEGEKELSGTSKAHEDEEVLPGTSKPEV